MSNQIEKVSHLELKKHVGLIHSTNHLSLLERKIANALLFNAYHELKEEQEHEIHLGNLSRLIGYNSKDFKTIKKSLMSLISTVLEWNILEKDKDDVWVACSMLADAKIDGPICTYSYSRRMRELCYFPEFYARLDLQTISSFKSTYGIALYENCVRYRNIKHTPWMTMSVYRKLMGVGDDKYKDFKSLKRRVINPSITEVNEYSQIYVESEFKKRGRAVSEIRFVIEESNRQISPINGSIESLLTNKFGLSSFKAKELTEKYEETYIREKIKLITTSKSYINGQINNLSRYVISSLEQDYQPPKSSKEHRAQILRQKEVEEVDRKKLIELKSNYINYLSTSIDEILDSVLPLQKKEFINGFEEQIKKTPHATWYLKKGLSDAIIQEAFARYLLSKHKDVINKFCSFEHYIEEKNLEPV